jgi:enolase
MSVTHIRSLHARQILDSRGRPTVEAEVYLEGGVVARASVPSGASTGRAEAVELRDTGDPSWGGLGVSAAVANIRGEIRELLAGEDALDQAGLDRRMVEADGTESLARLGGNAILAVSLAAVRAGAKALDQPLHERIGELAGTSPALPLPMANILSGGLHASYGMDVQDFLLMPIGAGSYGEALQWICRARTAAADLCRRRGLTTLLADEGGLSPGFRTTEEALALMVEAIERAGLEPGKDAAIALDLAASGLTDDAGHYHLEREGTKLDPPSMIERQRQWIRDFPVLSIEDGLGEEDWDNWEGLTQALAGIQIVGDDLFATQPHRIASAAKRGIANAALIKVNQNGTLSGTLDAIATARSAGYATVISARSGETEDDFLADLAVGVGGGQIKIGSVRNSERLAKYNQLLRLAERDIPWRGVGGLAPL